MKYEIRKISPDEAKKILEKNTRNRHVTQGHVDFLHAQMRTGQWIEGTGDPLRFNKEGELIDGQHRLMALIKTNATYSFLTITDVPDEAFFVMDTGRKRTLGDVLSISGFKDATNIGAAARMIILHKESSRGASAFAYGRSETISKRSTGLAEVLTNAKIMEFCKENDLDEARQFANKSYSICRLLRKSEWIFLYFILSEKSQEDASEFLTALATGANIPEKSALLYARQRLELGISRAITLTPKAKQFYVFRAWNAWRKRENVYILKYDPQKPMPAIV